MGHLLPNPVLSLIHSFHGKEPLDLPAKIISQWRPEWISRSQGRRVLRVRAPVMEVGRGSTCEQREEANRGEGVGRGWSPGVKVAYSTLTLGQSCLCPSAYDGMSPLDRGFYHKKKKQPFKIQIIYMYMCTIYNPL